MKETTVDGEELVKIGKLNLVSILTVRDRIFSRLLEFFPDKGKNYCFHKMI